MARGCGQLEGISGPFDHLALGDVIRHIREEIPSGASMPAAILHVRQKLVSFEKLDQGLVDQRFEDFACYWEKTDCWTVAGWLR